MRISTVVFSLCFLIATAVSQDRGLWIETRGTTYYHFMNGESYANYNNAGEVVRLGPVVHSQYVPGGDALRVKAVNQRVSQIDSRVYDLMGRFVTILEPSEVGIEANLLGRSRLIGGAYLVVSRREDGSIITRLVSVE